jgi:hypothetical protein
MKKTLILAVFFVGFIFSMAYAFINTLESRMTEAEIMIYVEKGEMSVAQAEKFGVYLGTDEDADLDGSEIMRLFEKVN